MLGTGGLSKDSPVPGSVTNGVLTALELLFDEVQQEDSNEQITDTLESFHMEPINVVTDLQGPTISQSLNTSPDNEINEAPRDDSNVQDENIVRINQLRSSSTLKVVVSINGVPVNAVVDTAAQVTIMSDKLFEILKPPCKIKRSITLQTAGRQLKFKGYVVGPIQVELGEYGMLRRNYCCPY